MSVIGEIHRRAVWQTFVLYGALAAATLFVAGLLVSVLALPEGFVGFARTILLVGLPLVLLTAWVQEGWGRKPSATPPPEPPRATGQPAPGNLSAGTGVVDRVSTRPSRLRRWLTWRTTLTAAILALAFWGVSAVGFKALTAWIESAAP